MDNKRIKNMLRAAGKQLGMSDEMLPEDTYDAVGQDSICSYKRAISNWLDRMPDEWYLRGACRSVYCSTWKLGKAPAKCVSCINLDKHEYQSRLDHIQEAWS